MRHETVSDRLSSAGLTGKLEHVGETENSGGPCQRVRAAAPLDRAPRRATVAHEGGKKLQSRGVDALQSAHIQSDRACLIQPACELRFERLRFGYRALRGQRQRSVVTDLDPPPGRFAGCSLGARRGAALRCGAARALARRSLLLAGFHNLVGARDSGHDCLYSAGIGSCDAALELSPMKLD